MAAATAQVGVATAQLFPQVVLGGAGGLAEQRLRRPVQRNRNDSKLLRRRPRDQLDGVRRRASQGGLKFAEARVDAAKAAYQDTVLQAFREVESSLVAVDRAQARVSDLQRLSASASESAAIARRDYERGLLDQLTVLDAQRQSNRADMLLVQGQVQLVVNVVTLYKALGGGWEVAEPSPATQPDRDES